LKYTSFYIAQRYLISKKGNQAVSFITGLAVIAMTVAVASMFVIVSVVSGLVDLNRSAISDLQADLTIYSKNGKTIKNIDNVIKKLSEESEISYFSKVVEEKAYISHKNKEDVVYLRGVDSMYIFVNPINENIYSGKYLSFNYSNEIIMETQLNSKLGVLINSNDDFAQILMPRPGTGLITKEEDIFNKKNVYPVGVFHSNLNGSMNNHIISPISLATDLLQLPKNAAYSIVMKIKNPDNANDVRNRIYKKLDSNDIEIKTKVEENSAFWKMVNTEKLMIYIIFGLVIFITTFNLAGAIIIIQLDKKNQAKALISMGMPMSDLRNIYFNTGVLIVSFGVISGLIIGSAICYLQQELGLFSATELVTFPVKIEWQNYIIVSGMAFLFGILVSWIFSRGKRSI